ncbi:MAG TPA: hypothetical protein VHA74_02015 [Candidatus Dojkabacteria bacterium]|nr:hypothetical protein [Candidatus Dojkabacteria bacterium]
MKTALKNIFIFLIVIVLVLISYFVVNKILLSQKASNTNQNNSSNNNDTQTQKPYKLCISGYYPANYPDYTSTDIQNYFDDVNTSSQIYGIHTNYESLQLITLSTAYLDSNVSINLVIGTKDNIWKGKENDIVNKLSTELDKHNQIRYVGIGNEINNSFKQNSQTYLDFLNAYKKIYTQLKTKYPTLKIYTVFQYELLLGKGYLTGKVTNKSQVSMVDDFKNYSDLVGLTTYPFFDYKNPKDIPTTYFQPLEKYKKDILITETGWPSKALDNNQTIFNASEDIQLTYLNKLITIAQKDKNIESLCWLGVNDLNNWIKGNNNLRIFNNLGLKDEKGVEKEVWKEWNK